MQYISLAIAIVFLIGLGFSINSGDTGIAIYQLIVGTLMLIFFLFFRMDSRNKKEFAEWLAINGDQALKRGQTYNGILIDEGTRFLQYEVCLSVAIFSFKRKSAYYIEDLHPTLLISLICTLYAVIFGWWSLPMGPFKTLGAIIHNFFAKSKSLEAVIMEVTMKEQQQ